MARTGGDDWEIRIDLARHVLSLTISHGAGIVYLTLPPRTTSDMASDESR